MRHCQNHALVVAVWPTHRPHLCPECHDALLARMDQLGTLYSRFSQDKYLKRSKKQLRLLGEID